MVQKITAVWVSRKKRKSFAVHEEQTIGGLRNVRPPMIDPLLRGPRLDMAMSVIILREPRPWSFHITSLLASVKVLRPIIFHCFLLVVNDDKFSITLTVTNRDCNNNLQETRQQLRSKVS